MNSLRLALLAALSLFLGLINLRSDTFNNPIVSDGADPWMVYKDGFYYYTQTTGADVKVRRCAHITGTLGVGGASEVSVYTPPAPYNQNVWAPELHYLQGKWYIYYAADDGNNANHRLYVLESVLSDPQGTYTNKGKIFDATTDRWAIDGTVLEKGDGSLYFIWSGWPGSVDGQQNLYVAPMSNPWTISGPRVLLSTPTYSWEGWINEGPEVLQRNGKIFVVYSANASWLDDYCLGMLANTNGDVLNPSAWTKIPNPVFQKFSDANGGVYGPGHCSFTRSLDQTEDWLVYHAAKFSGAGWNRNVRTQKFSWNPDDSPNFGYPIPPSVPLNVPSGEGTPIPPFGDYTLTANATAGGSVSKDPDQSTYASNSIVTMTATADAGYYFYSWFGDASGANNPLAVTMDRSKIITAWFTNEIILDNSSATFAGSWSTGTSSADKYGSDYRYASTAATVTRTATFTPNIQSPGKYDVYVWYPQGANRSTAAPYLVAYLDSSVTVAVDQQTGGGGWRLIASEKKFGQGTAGFVQLANNTGESGKLVMADAVRFVYSANQDLPPTITSQPQNQMLVAGASAAFSVTATGSQPLAYQWRLNGVEIPGATAATYALNNVQPADAGDYSVVVSNPFGTAISANARLAVNVPPAITTQPQCQTINQTESVTFFVEVSGSAPFGYQWRFNSNSIAGANFASYTITNATAADAGNYSVIISNGVGSVTSSNAVLTVEILPGSTSPTVTRHPAAQTINQGATATFSVEANGLTLSYQWRFNDANLPGATANFYQRIGAQPGHQGNYSVVVSNVFGVATSSNALLTVNVPPTISFQPQSQVLVQGQNANFSVVADGTPPLGFQWKFNGTAISGATTTAYARTNAQSSDAGIYTVAISNVAGTVTSSNATLTVNVPPAITAQPQSQTLNVGISARFSVAASGTPPLSYQWRFNDTNIAGATASVLTLPSVQAKDGGNYSVIITNIAGAATSDPAILTVLSPPPVFDVPILMNDGTIQLFLTGNTGELYRIESSTNLADWNMLTLATNTTGTVSFSDAEATNYLQRFYRAVLVP